MQLNFDKRDLAESIEVGISLAILWLGKVIAWIVLITAVIGFTPWLRDRTDEPGWFGSRSGMSFYTDHQTGCQYLASNGLTPRVDGTGRHMGCYEGPDHGP